MILFGIDQPKFVSPVLYVSEHAGHGMGHGIYDKIILLSFPASLLKSSDENEGISSSLAF